MSTTMNQDIIRHLHDSSLRSSTGGRTARGLLAYLSGYLGAMSEGSEGISPLECKVLAGIIDRQLKHDPMRDLRHSIRAHLQSVSSAGEVMAVADSTPEARAKMLDVIRRAVKAMARELDAGEGA